MITWRARAYKPRESTRQPHTGHHWASREHAGALAVQAADMFVASCPLMQRVAQFAPAT